MRIIAVDDEMLQLETIMEYVTELYPSVEFVSYDRVSDALADPRIENTDIAILDIQMPGNINGINLGEMLRQRNRRIKLLFCSGYSNYAIDAFKMHANGYLEKPIRKDDLMREIEYVMQMPVWNENKKPYIHTFGSFDLFVNNRPVIFKRSKSKEILAYCTDREGGWVTNRELAAVLWEESSMDLALSRYITVLSRDLVLDLEGVGAERIIERQRGKLRLRKEEVVCDYYDYMVGDEQAINQFHQEYMSQYSWGENTLASLVRDQVK